MKILYNAHIHTPNSSEPSASALVIDREWILAVGDSNDLLAQYPNAEKEDMQGRFIFPGLTDAHLHLQHYAHAVYVAQLHRLWIESLQPQLAHSVRRWIALYWISTLSLTH